jgi:hypothetical protein
VLLYYPLRAWKGWVTSFFEANPKAWRDKEETDALIRAKNCLSMECRDLTRASVSELRTHWCRASKICKALMFCQHQQCSTCRLK